MPDARAHKLVIAVDLIVGNDLDAFMALLSDNARQSLRDEPGCRQFDICLDEAEPGHIFLYEIYDDEAAFAAHLNSSHYQQFDIATKAMIRSKRVQRYSLTAG